MRIKVLKNEVLSCCNNRGHMCIVDKAIVALEKWVGKTHLKKVSVVMPVTITRE